MFWKNENTFVVAWSDLFFVHLPYKTNFKTYKNSENSTKLEKPYKTIFYAI